MKEHQCCGGHQHKKDHGCCGGHGHSPHGHGKERIKNRLPVAEMKAPIEEYLQHQREIFISVNNDSIFPMLECVEYRYISGIHLLILTSSSVLLEEFKEGSQFSGLICGKMGPAMKSNRRISGKFTCHSLEKDSEILVESGKQDEFIGKMLNHSAKFFRLTHEDLTVFFSMGEIFSLDENMEPSFAKTAPNGKKRYENSRHVVMAYDNREVIFNTIVEGKDYFTLTKADSNKISYIKNGGVCQFFDGRDNHFSSTVDMLEETQVAVVYKKLAETNHSFFKSMEGLVALKFTKE